MLTIAAVSVPTLTMGGMSFFVRNARITEPSDQIIMPCTYNVEWTTDDDYGTWIARDPTSNTRAKCKVCEKTFDISTMGTSAVKSHMKGVKHQSRMKSDSGSLKITAYISRSAAASTSSSSATETSTTSVASSVSTHVTRLDILNAEIWWCLKVVAAGYSFRSSEDISFLWRNQFPDSEIAQQCQVGETKCMYLTGYGLAPHFRSLLLTKVRHQPYVLIFDESLNEEQQMKQLDLLVRFWDHDSVQTRYLTSIFMGHATANDLLQAVCHGIRDIGYSTLCQLSMDGPNVNWSFFTKFDKTIETEHGTQLLNVGSCGLHTLHNAFKAGCLSTKWEVTDFLTALYILFDDVPARREDYEEVTDGVSGGSLYPKRFCSHRWLENKVVAQRALEMLPAVKVYVKAIESGKLKSPGTKSFETVRRHIGQELLQARLACFVSVARVVEPFLTMYQTDNVLLPFIAQDLDKIIRNLLRRFMKHDIVNAADTCLKLIQLDISGASSLMSSKNIDAGFVANGDIKDLLCHKKISEKQALEFRMASRDFAKAIVKKVVEKCPIKYKLVRGLVCLDPRLIQSDPEKASSKFQLVLQCMVDAKRVQSDDVDVLKDEFHTFATECKHLDEFKSYSVASSHLEKLFFDHLRPGCSAGLWEVIQALLLLSHGQAAVERGFSINKVLSTENQNPETLISLRLVKDHINSVGGLKFVKVGTETVTMCSSARKQYHEHLERKKEALKRKKTLSKRKAAIVELEEFKKKIKLAEDDLSAMKEQSDKNYDRAEETKKVCYAATGNAIRRAMCEKDEQLKHLREQLKVQQGVISNL